jgi:hypothetical protein
MSGSITVEINFPRFKVIYDDGIGMNYHRSSNNKDISDLINNKKASIVSKVMKYENDIDSAIFINVNRGYRKLV